MDKAVTGRLSAAVMLCPLAVLVFIRPGFSQTNGNMPGMAAGAMKPNAVPSAATGHDQMDKGAGGAMKGMPGMQSTATMPMKAMLGSWSANREGSGTSWQTDSAPMFMKMLPAHGGVDLSTMGTIQAGYVDAGG